MLFFDDKKAFQGVYFLKEFLNRKSIQKYAIFDDKKAFQGVYF